MSLDQGYVHLGTIKKLGTMKNNEVKQEKKVVHYISPHLLQNNGCHKL